jgi:exonuclease SbcC
MHADHHSRRAALLGGELLETHRQRRLDEARAAEDALRKTQERHGLARATLAGAQEALRASDAQLATCAAQLQEREAQWTLALNAAGLAPDECAALLAQDRAETARLQQQADALENSLAQASAIAAARAHDLQALLAADIPARALDLVETERAAAQTQAQERHIAYARAEDARARDDLAREKIGALAAKIAAAEAQTRLWRDMNAAIGSANGDKFVKFAQGQTLDLLVERANLHLEDLKPRYRLQRADGELGLWVIDHDNGDDARATRSLSGGERFLISLALALALSGLGGRQSFAETLFIDEGFGALDSESLDLALDALERLRAQGRMIGVVSHVDAMKERIRAQVRVERQGPGRSTVRIVCA